MIVIIDNGRLVKKFSSHVNAYEYAQRMMEKQHEVWMVSPKVLFYI